MYTMTIDGVDHQVSPVIESMSTILKQHKRGARRNELVGVPTTTHMVWYNPATSRVQFSGKHSRRHLDIYDPQGASGRALHDGQARIAAVRQARNRNYDDKPVLA